MRRLGKGTARKTMSIQVHSDGPSTRRGDHRVGSLGIEVCDVCNICFYSKTSLSVHRRIHWRDCIFDCPICIKRFNSLTNLRAHQKTHCYSTAVTSKPASTTKATTITSKSQTKAPTVMMKSPNISSTKKIFQTAPTTPATTTTKLHDKTKKPTSKMNSGQNISSVVCIMSPKKRVLQTEGEYRCRTCSKICIGKLDLASHERTHKSSRKKSSKTWFYVRTKDVKTKMAGTTMACLLCKKTFFEERGLTKHIREAHRGQDMSEIDNIRPENILACSNCDVVFSDETELVKHEKSCKNDEDDDDSEDDEDSEVEDKEDIESKIDVEDNKAEIDVEGDDVEIDVEGDEAELMDIEASEGKEDKDNKIVPCPHCGKIFKNHQGLGRHTRLVHKDKQSGKRGAVKDLKKKREEVPIKELGKDLRKQTLPYGKTVSCHVCMRQFVGGVAFSNHLRQKHPSEPYPYQRRSKYWINIRRSKKKSLREVTPSNKEPSTKCKESFVLVEKLNEKLVHMVAGNERVFVSETENATCVSGIDPGELNAKEEGVAVVEKLVTNAKVKGKNLGLVNGKVGEDGGTNLNPAISMEIDESNKIAIEKEFAKDCGEVVESPVHVIKNASDLEIVSVDNSFDIVEVEIGDIGDKAPEADDVIPLETPKKDDEINLPETAPVTKSNSPTATLQKAPPLQDGEKVEDSEKMLGSNPNDISPTKIAQSEENKKVNTVTKNVPKLTEDKPSTDKGSENPELKGIIDFINNDCSD